ncbi:MAG: 6-carboxytetrahydropterin synthase [Bacteroidia bacterium]|jgi:6-pyruvoyltetrahydropterin/6-carboxytetrahydropterin synthase|nr:6-carboxytetrahydropterin synthase [Bacteroidia bacterium]
MAVLHLTRKEHFNAAHRLWNDRWSEEKNNEVFGKCANPHFHGHNFDLHISVKGTPDPDTGCIINLKDLKKIIHKEILEELDHKNLNIEVEWLSHCIPSIENMAISIWQRLLPHLPQGVELSKIVLWETHNNYVEYYGE